MSGLLRMKNKQIINKEKLLVAALLLFFAALTFSSSLYKSPVFDEGIHLAAGYNAWVNRDFRINPENGLIPAMLGALPLIFDDSIENFSKESRWWNICDHWKITEDFLYHSGNDFKKMFFQARIIMVIIAVLGGIALYLASRRLWGRSGALISLTLFALSPTVLTHSRFVISDMVFSIFFFLSAWLFWRLLNQFTVLRLFLLSLTLALLALSKMSAILILPVLLIIGIIRIFIGNKWRINIFSHRYLFKKRLHQSGMMILILLFTGLFSFCVMWGAFGFRYSMLSDEKGRNVLKNVWSYLLEKNNLPTKCISFAQEHQLIPEAYQLGFAFILQNTVAKMAFLNGKYSSTGWRYFFPLAFVYKTPISIILLFLFGIGASLLILMSGSKKKKLLVVWYISFPAALMIVYFSVIVMSNVNIGHRYILPIYLPLFVIAGGTSIWIKKYGLPMKISVILILLVLLIENLFIYPDYLGYFSPVAGGASNGYKCLVDGFLDWGQDLKGLKNWIKTEKLNNDDVYIAYFGSVDLDAYGMPQKRLLCYFEQKRNSIFKLKGGVYCISATMLQMLYCPKYIRWDLVKEKEYRNTQIQFNKLFSVLKKPEQLKILLNDKGENYWMNVCRKHEELRFAKLINSLRKRAPNHMIGYSYLIFELTDEEVRNILTP